MRVGEGIVHVDPVVVAHLHHPCPALCGKQTDALGQRGCGKGGERGEQRRETTNTPVS